MKEHHRHRLSDYVASSDNYALLAGNINIIAANELHYSRRSTGQKAVVPAHNMPHVVRVERVHVLFRGDAFKGFYRVKTLRKWHLEKYSVNVPALGKGVYYIFKALLAHVFAEGIDFAQYPHVLTCALFIADVNLRRGVLPH